MIAPIAARLLLPAAARLVIYLLNHPKTAERAFKAMRPLTQSIVAVMKEIHAEGTTKASDDEAPKG